MKIHAHYTMHMRQNNPFKAECGISIRKLQDLGWKKKKDFTIFISNFHHTVTCKHCINQIVKAAKEYKAKMDLRK